MLAKGARLAEAGVAFQYREFRLYQAARFAMTIGMQMQGVAVGWQVYAITRRPLDLGYVGLALFLPAVVFSLLTGHIADRFNRRNVLLACQLLLGLCFFLLLMGARSQSPSVLHIYAVLTIVGACRAFAGPAGAALMPNLVPAPHFPNAVAWSASIWQVSTVVGPALGGIVYGIAGGPASVYALSLGLMLTAAALVWKIRAPAQVAQPGPTSWERLSAGIRYVWRNKIILGSISLDLFAVLLGGAVALLPVFARDILHVGPAGLGALRSAPGLGALLVALALAFRPLDRRAGPIMLGCVALFGIATIVFGLSRNFAISVAALFIAGACDMVSVFVRQTLVQLTTPDAMRGRVSAVNLVFIGASNELGEFESGLTAAWFGTVPAVVIGGVGTCLVVLACSLLFPELARVDRLSAVNPVAKA
jgi:MFS family permease